MTHSILCHLVFWVIKTAKAADLHGERRGCHVSSFQFQRETQFSFQFHSPITFIFAEEKRKAHLHTVLPVQDWKTCCWRQTCEMLIGISDWERCNWNKGPEKNSNINTTYYIWEKLRCHRNFFAWNILISVLFFNSSMLTKDTGLRLHFVLLKRKVQQLVQFLQRILPAYFHVVWTNSHQKDKITSGPPGPANLWVHLCQGGELCSEMGTLGHDWAVITNSFPIYSKAKWLQHLTWWKSWTSSTRETGNQVGNWGIQLRMETRQRKLQHEHSSPRQPLCQCSCLLQQ